MEIYATAQEEMPLQSFTFAETVDVYQPIF